jgi:poly-gamma-glutamate capsule biosynthesis protein CapA/YwtB (metallophosphatase superfamily)
MPDNVVEVMVAGDVYPNVADGLASFRDLREILAAADVVAANCEGAYSDQPSPAPSHKHMMVSPTERGGMLAEAGFDVLSLANNHMIDGGYAGLEDTRELLQAQGIATMGAGENLAAALRPAIVERGGVRIAFLGFCSVFPVGYEARPGRPGISAVRVRTHYDDPDPNFWEPGIDPVITTEPFPEDLARYIETIAATREQADVVFVLNHWGYSSRLEILQDYELQLARAAADAGADAVLCCHHHSLRGIEFRGGSVIFYGLGTLVHHLTTLYPPSAAELGRRRRKFGAQAHIPDPGFPLFPFHPDARQTGLAVLDVSGDGVVSVGFVPALIRADGSTEPLRPGDKRAHDVLGYLRRITADRGFTTVLRPSERHGYLLAVAEPGPGSAADAPAEPAAALSR